MFSIFKPKNNFSDIIAGQYDIVGFMSNQSLNNDYAFGFYALKDGKIQSYFFDTREEWDEHGLEYNMEKQVSVEPVPPQLVHQPDWFSPSTPITCRIDYEKNSFSFIELGTGKEIEIAYFKIETLNKTLAMNSKDYYFDEKINHKILDEVFWIAKVKKEHGVLLNDVENKEIKSKSVIRKPL